MANKVVTKQPIADGRVTVIPAVNPDIIRATQQPKETIRRHTPRPRVTFASGGWYYV